MNELRCSRPDDSSRRPGPAADRWSEAITRQDPQSPLRVTFSHHTATLQLSGIIDESTHALLTAALTRAAAGTQHTLHIDLTGVTFCDLPGLRALVSLASHAAPAKRVMLAGLSPEAGSILHILGWDATPGLAVQPDGPPQDGPDTRPGWPGAGRKAR